ncbi:MAG: C-type lectin domain-containing protein [Myxococcales bacterium]|nr:C-type lectin domain-containing protein [Myxococcales bacterium]
MHAGHCYLFRLAPESYVAARNRCRNIVVTEHGGGSAQLASIGGMMENDFVALESNTGGARLVWLGLTDAALEGTFVWLDGSPLAFTHWAGGEPNGGTGENCVWLSSDMADTAYGQWVDASCVDTAPAICEYAW